MMTPRCGMFFYIYTNMYIIRWFYEMMKPQGGCVWYTRVYMYMLILWWWDVMRTRWWLRSTTGSYGRPAIKVAYGETLIHSTEVVWEILAWEEWLGCRYDASSMFDIPKSTPMWAPYIYGFSRLSWYNKKYIVLKVICSTKKTLVVSDLVLARQGSENVFDCPWALKREFKNHRQF